MTMNRKTMQVLAAIVLLLIGLVVFLWTSRTPGNWADGGREVTVTAPDGTPIRCMAWGEGEPALVFIHGWSCDGGYWRHQVQPFAADHRVVALDLAGHGNSGGQRQDYTMEAFGRDVVAVLEALDIGDAVLVGHSMGGPVAVEAALAAPARVRGVVGVDNFQDPSFTLTAEQIAGFAGAMQADFPGTVEPWVLGMFPAGSDTALAVRIAADMASAPPSVGVSAITRTLEWMGGGGNARLTALKVNLTTVSSDNPPTDVEGNRALVPGFKARILPGTGHFLMLEKPAEFNALLAEAIAEFAPPARQGP